MRKMICYCTIIKAGWGRAGSVDNNKYNFVCFMCSSTLLAAV